MRIISRELLQYLAYSTATVASATLTSCAHRSHTSASPSPTRSSRSSVAAWRGPKCESQHLHLRCGDEFSGSGSASYGGASGHMPVKCLATVPGAT